MPYDIGYEWEEIKMAVAMAMEVMPYDIGYEREEIKMTVAMEVMPYDIGYEREEIRMAVAMEVAGTSPYGVRFMAGQEEIMLSYAVLSKPGERDHNEDYTGIQQKGDYYCFVLADGLGGHGGGDEASRIVVESIRADFARKGEVSLGYLQRSFALGQWMLLEEQKRQQRRMEMKTTLTVLLAGHSRILWGHVGDSRIYYFQDKRLKCRTLDHSVPQMLAAAGKIREKQIRGHADRSRLLRVMGIEWEEPQYELAEGIQRRGGEAFLLCSDGFWEWVLEKQMQHTLKKAPGPKEWLQAMEQIVLKNGSGQHMDNYSAVAVFL